MGSVHTCKDTKISEDDVKKKEGVVNGYTSMFLKMSRMGESWNHEDRMRESNIKHSMYVSPMSLLVKDHKKVKEGEAVPTRPVVSANEGIGTSLSTILSEFLEPLADSLEDRMEVISTEDYLNRLTECNRRLGQEWTEGEELVHIGADVKALFPSLSAQRSGRIVREVVLESDMKFEGVDYRAAAMLVRYGMDHFEIRKLGLERIVPKRRYHRGQEPGVTSKEALGGDGDRDEDKWIFPPREPTETEKRSLIAACLEIGVRTSFRNSVYQFGGQYYLQTNGGPIGARVTMAVSRIVMYDWGKKLRNILREAEIKIWMDSAYVDDYRSLLSALRPGLRWEPSSKKLEFREDWREEDLKSEVSTTRRSATVLQAVMDSINPDLKFEMELEEDFPDNKLPTLDCRVWLETSPDSNTTRTRSRVASQPPQFNFSFFEKTMNSQYVILENSAMSYKMKCAILSQEVVRRMLNTKETISQRERNEILNSFSEKMLRSGYDISQVREIFISGIRGYMRRVSLAEQKGSNLYRSAKSSLAERIKKKVFEKTSWYREKRNFLKKGPRIPGRKSSKRSKSATQKKIKSVLFVPRTERGELLRRLREEETKLADITGYRVKLVERSGTQLSRILCQKNPWAGQDCGRADCLVCGDSEVGGGDCRRRNITYVTTCVSCIQKLKEDKTAREPARYVGESCRSAYERGKEHLEGYLHGREESHMAKHRILEHPGEEVTFKMKVLAKHKSAFERQVTEAVLIEVMDDGRLLNSKGGFNRCVLPRLQVAVGDKVAEYSDNNSERSSFHEILTARQENSKRKEREDKIGSDSEKKEALTTASFNRNSIHSRKIKIPKKRKKQISPSPTFNFVPLSRVFAVTENAPGSAQGSNDRGSGDQDKRTPG